MYGDLTVSGDLQCDNVVAERKNRYRDTDGTTVDDARNEVSFDYNTAGSGIIGPILSIATLGGGYKMQLQGSYINDGNAFAIRTRNDDTDTKAWNPWRTLLHSGNVADYIVSQGTSGIWRYRTYSSGVKECWCAISESFTSQTSWGSGYLGYMPYHSFPFTFSRTPTAMVTVGDGKGIQASIGELSTTTIQAHFLSMQYMGSGATNYYIHAIG